MNAPAPALSRIGSDDAAAPQACDVFVINLDRSPERFRLQARQAERLGIAIERIGGVEGEALAEKTYRRYAARWQRPLSRSEVGCLLGHHACWERVVAAGRNALILEDDAVLAPGIAAFLAEADVIDGPSLVNLETRGERRFLSRRPVMTLAGTQTRLYTLHMAVAGGTAYLVTPEAAARLMAALDRRAAPADAFLWNAPGIRRLQAEPALGVALDILARHYGAEPVHAAARSTIRRPALSHLRSVAALFRHPVLRARRVRGQVGVGLGKALMALKTSKRAVLPSTSIFASYEAMKGTSDG